MHPSPPRLRRGFIASAGRSVSKLMALRLGPQTLLTLIATETAASQYCDIMAVGERILEHNLSRSRGCRASRVNPDIAARWRCIARRTAFGPSCPSGGLKRRPHASDTKGLDPRVVRLGSPALVLRVFRRACCGVVHYDPKTKLIRSTSS